MIPTEGTVSVTYFFVFGYTTHDSCVNDTIKNHAEWVNTLWLVCGETRNDALQLFVLGFDSFNCVQHRAYFNLVNKNKEKTRKLYRKFEEGGGVGMNER